MDERLQRLIAAHSTPGDEAEVGAVLESSWRESGWRVERCGAYAVAAHGPSGEEAKPVLLICAHMDAPGYAVDRLRVDPCGNPSRFRVGVTELGAPELDGDQVAAVLKTRRGRFHGALRRVDGAESEAGLRFEMDAADAAKAEVRHGDRVCFSPFCDREGSLLLAPFLDNRLGCWLLTRIAAEALHWQTPFRIVLGATAAEETGGFGARVLAARVRPDLVAVLDTTYESAEQDVRLGGGPVLTLSDASVLLSPALRDRALDLMAEARVPMQTEVYNFSGTDARAFPQQGLACPVLPILIPTRGNHSPCETADQRDLEAWLAAVRAIAEKGLSLTARTA